MYIKISNIIFDRLLVNSWDSLEAPGMGVRIMDKVNNYDKCGHMLDQGPIQAHHPLIVVNKLVPS